MTRICIVVATLFTAKAFLLDQIAQLSRRYDVTVAANDVDPTLFSGLPVTLAQIPIERRISLLSDARALLGLYRLFRRERFNAVHSFTPKAGFLAMLASFAAHVPVRIHTFTGQVWATRTGVSRLLLKTMDCAMAAAATHVVVDSPSQCAFLRREGVLPEHRGEVLAQGSISGVDARRFTADATVRAAARRELDIPADAVIFLFVGRLSRDKGVLDLARAFAAVARAERNVWLLLIGPDEDGLTAGIRATAGEAEARLRFLGMTDAPERYLPAGDVFVLPSYREGFGSVIIEAAAAGLPAIGTRIYGVVDAIEEGATGLLVPPGDVDALADAMRRLATDEAARLSLGAAARERAQRDFSQAKLTSALLAFYERALPAAPRTGPPKL
jgi:glycosyltransferase involved in cell wall biosynthesis